MRSSIFSISFDLTLLTCLVLLLASPKGYALGPGDSAPSLAELTLVFGQPYQPLDQPQALEVVYFWATWCAPCRLSTARLGELVKEHPKRIRVRALSEEAPEVVRAYLKDNAQPFSYLQRLNSHPALASYLEDVSFLPFVFLFKEGALVWKGNPTYPKGEFDAVMRGLLTGEGEAPQAREVEEVRALREELKGLKAKKKNLAQTLSALSAELIEGQQRLSGLVAPTFMEFDAVFWERYDELLLDRMAAGGKLSEAREARYVSEIRAHIERYLTLFQERRDDLIYLTADLYGVEEPSLRQLDLAERALKQLEALSDQEVTYPDYELSLRARSAGERGDWTQALRRVDEAISLARRLKRPDGFLRGFLELKRELEAGLHRCEGLQSR